MSGESELGNVVEVRVHGVSGTPADELLDRPLVDRVAGDAIAGFYRPRLQAESRDSFPVGVSDPEIEGPVLEGYVWGGLTSGAPSRAFWLLLIPFTLGNVVPRMRPAACGPRRVGLIWYLSRILALTLTIVLVAGFVGIGVDLVGWQCSVHAGRCGGASPGWLMDPIRNMGTGRRILVGSLVPTIGLFVLWYLSVSRLPSFEARGPYLTTDGAENSDSISDPADAVEVKLDSRWMWQSAPAVRRLSKLHVQVGFAVMLAMIGASTRDAWEWVDGLVALAVLTFAAVALSRRSFGSRLAVGRWDDLSNAIWGGLVVEAIGTGYWLFRNDHLTDHPQHCSGVGTLRTCAPAGLPHFGETLVWLLLVQLVIVTGIAICVVGRPFYRQKPLGERGPRPEMFGMGSAAFGFLAVFLGAVFTSGAYVFAAAWLSTGSIRPGLSAVTAVSRTFAVPGAILDGALAYSIAVLTLIVFVVLVAVWAVWVYLRINVNSVLLVRRSFLTDYPHAPTTGRNARVKSLLRDRWEGRLVDLAGSAIGVLTLIGALISYVFGVILLLEHALHVNGAARWLLDPANRADRAHPTSGIAFFSRVGLQGKGAYLVVWTLVLLVVLGSLAFKAKKTRRSVGILWDIASFWPRLCHPLAPPCYAERTVPDLVQRIRWHVSQGRPVVLAGHSQGSVISAATVQQLHLADEFAEAADEPATLPNVALLTFGCVIRRLHGRFFPAYFGPETLRQVGEAVSEPTTRTARWWNLWRYTDYLGGPLLSGPPPTLQQAWDPAQPLPTPPDPETAPPCVDLHLIDPAFGPAPGDTALPPPLRHSDYWSVPEFQAAAAGLARLLDEGRTSTT